MDALSQLKQDLDAKWCTSLRVRWLQECLVFLESASHSNGLSSRSTLTTQVEDQLLLSDLGYSTHGCIPLDVASRHGQVLRGKFLVQVQDCVNVSESSDRRYSHTTNRTLKMGLFDGKISVTAMELTHIPQISLDFPAGFKVRNSSSLTPLSRFLLVLTCTSRRCSSKIRKWLTECSF